MLVHVFVSARCHCLQLVATKNPTELQGRRQVAGDLDGQRGVNTTDLRRGLEAELFRNEIERLGRPIGATSLVVLRRPPEDLRERVAQETPASKKARFSFSISRAITRRWIWFVPS